MEIEILSSCTIGDLRVLAAHAFATISYFSLGILYPNFSFLAISCFQGQNCEVLCWVNIII